jgi:hypothetical protein
MADDRSTPAAGRPVPDPGYAGDEGAADPRLGAALAACAADPERAPEVLVALRDARLLVPVVAVLGEVEHDDAGLAHDKTSEMPVSSGVEMPVSSEVEMATALLTGQDGRQALLAFTSLETLAAWRPDARPVPVAAPLAARSALQEGAAALVVDVAGPTTYVVEGAMLEGLARGWSLTVTDRGPAWVEHVE